MSKHTPGPWRVERQNPSPTNGEWMIAGAKPGYLAEVRDCGSGDVQENAYLIASAPELYEALRDALYLIETLTPIEGDTCRKVRKAIAKAEGGE